MADYDCKLCKDYNTGVNCYHCENGSKFKKINNFEKIRNMSVEEMAEFINGIDRYDDYAILINGDTVIDMTSCILEWIQSEAE